MADTSDYFDGKAAIVTGGAAGLGLALAEAMLTYGLAALVLIDRDGPKLSSQVARLNDLYPQRVLGVEADVTNEEQVRRAIDAGSAFGGRLDILINNAGAGLGGLFDQQANDDWAKAFAINFYGPLYGIRAALPIMRAQRDGHIVNIVSGIAFAPMAQQSMYAATKAALNALSLALRYELWDEGIRVSSATPGVTATDIWRVGGKEPPPHAQSPERAAEVILAGVARNERLVLGDEGDAQGAVNAFNPTAADGMDDYLLDVARRRRNGEVAV